MADHSIELSVYHGRSGLDQLTPQWRQLARRQGAHFLHFPAWYAAHLSADGCDPLVFCALRRADRLLGVIPVSAVTLRKGPLSLAVHSLGYANEMGLSDGLLPDGQGVAPGQLARALRDAGVAGRLLKFDCIADGGQIASWLGRFNLPTKTSHTSKYLDLSAGREAFYAGYSSKFRRNMRRKHKKALEQGELRVERFRNAAALPALEEFLRLENSGWKGREGTSIASQPDKLRYYQVLTQGLSDDGVLSVNLLKLAGKPIAAQVGVLIGKRLNLLKIAYDESCSDISPGYLLIDGLITEPDDDNFVEKISFVTGVDWIDRWKPHTEPVRVAYTTHCSLLDGLLAKLLVRRQRHAAVEPAVAPAVSAAG